MTNNRAFEDALEAHPVMSVLSEPELLSRVLAAEAPAVTVASMELSHMANLIAALRKNNKMPVVNIDAIAGLSQDRGGLGFLESIGVQAVVTTRGSLVSRIRASGLVAIQKVFITDRTNMSRMQNSVQLSNPEYVELMPQPVVDIMTPQELRPFGKTIVAGFVRTKEDVHRALAQGAAGASSSSASLWSRSGLI